MKSLTSIIELASNMGVDWKESDYFIMPDVILLPYPENQNIHLDFYALFTCVSGKLDMYINEQYTRIEKFCLYALCPENIIRPGIPSKDCRLKIMVFTKNFLVNNNFKLDTLDVFTFFLRENYNKIQLKGEEADSLLQLFDLLNVKITKHQYAFHVEIIKSLFYTFLYEVQSIYSKGFEKYLTLSNRENELNKKFKELINKQATIQRNIKYYSDQLFISPKYLITIIKNATGKTPKAIINEVIMEYAKHYLIYTNQNIGEITESLNFSDIAAFSKFFKRYTTLSPTDYRKKYQS